MNLYLLLSEDPFYTKEFVGQLLEAFPGEIVGAAFPDGFINKRRIVYTFFIYGPLRFAKTVVAVSYYKMKGGKVRMFLEKNGIKTRTVKNVNDPIFLEYLRSLNIDIIISNNCPQRLKQNILDIPKKGSINLHLGKLPAYRGVFPVLHAIINGEKSFGLTVHFMDEEFDNGAIIVQKEIPITQQDTLFTLYPKAFLEGAKILIEAIKSIRDGAARVMPNGPQGKSYFSYPSFRQILKYHGLIKRR